MTAAWLCALVLGGAILPEAVVHASPPQADRRANLAVPRPHENVFGTDIRDEECAKRSKTAELQDIYDGLKLPYVFTGPDQACDTSGCRHGYWGSRCRFDGRFSPACKLIDRQKVTSWLSTHAKNGSQWAADILTLKPCDLWPNVRGRTTWIIGDSLSQDMAYTLACFFIEYFAESGKELAADAATLYSLTHTASGRELSAWCYNATMGTRICSLRANKIPRMAGTILPLLPSIADREKDIVMLNIGAWYNYISGEMVDLDVDAPKLEEALRVMRPILPKRLLWREAAAQHFRSPSGMFDFTQTIEEQRCQPPGANMSTEVVRHSDGSLTMAPGAGPPTNWTELQVMLSGGHRNRVTQPVIDRLAIPTLPIWNLSLVVHDVHKDYHSADGGGTCVTVDCDCSHACLPSWYQMILPEFGSMLKRWDQALVATTR